MINSRQHLVIGALLVVIAGGSAGFYGMIKRQQHLEQGYLQLCADIESVVDYKPEIQQVVERVVSNAQLWRPVQEQIDNTVVQIFSQVAETDLLQPYKTPAQGTSSGSGFFINEDGDILTNAHVVDQAKALWIQIQELGKRILDVDLIGVSPERDIALLRLSPESKEIIRKELGSISFLPLGDSDILRRSDEVMALGYPLGQQSLKATNGMYSGNENRYLQISAPINPGNSGGPLLNAKGEVVGVNSAGIMKAQNVGYAIPINEVKIILPDLYTVKLLRKPFLGIVFNNATDALTDYLGNPQPGGAYVVEVVKDSTLDKAGVKRGDMIYQINGYRLDIYGEMRVVWSEDKVSLIDYVSRLSIGQEISLIIYRNGVQHEIVTKFEQMALPPVSEIYPSYEPIDYEVFGGMVVMPLTINHLQLLGSRAPGLAKYMDIQQRAEPALIITHIFPSSYAYRSRAISVGSTIHEVNGMAVNTLAQYRVALKNAVKNKHLVLRVADNVARRSDNVIVALEWNKLIEQEAVLSRDYIYPMSSTAKDLIEVAQASRALQPATRAV
jgi:serine protease Do